MKKYTYTLNDAGIHNQLKGELSALNAATAPGLQWEIWEDTLLLVPDFLQPGCKVAGHWNKQDVELYGVSFEDFEKYVNQLGYEVVYNN